jgi:1-acylglycerone phosphate reductase
MAPPQQNQQQRGGAATSIPAAAAAFAAKALKAPPAPPLIALITGCTPGGIGHALALDLASRPGWRVIATARRKDQLKALAELAETLELDVSSQKSIDAAKKQVDRLTHKGVDVLVNNAGVNVKGTVLDTDMAAIERLMAVNVQGTIAVTKTFAPAMAAKRRGLIVNVGSAAGYTYGPIEACYAASKAAVRALTDGLRVEMAPLGVKVMLVAPGFVKTRIDDQPGRSSGSSGGGAVGTASGLWFPPRARKASGGGSSAAAASGGAGAQLDASASSPYALYGWLSRMVRTSIFELGPGVLHDTPQAFAARLGAAIVAEVPRAPRPVPLLARRALATAAGANKPNQGRGSGGSGGGAPAMAMGPLPPPSTLDMVAGWRWWAPHALGGPRRHFRAAPFAVVTWLVGALAPLWVADLVLGLYMGLWTAL